MLRHTPTATRNETLSPYTTLFRSSANATITTKRMRVWLHANMRNVHEHNATWIFTQSQYDVVRSHFDAKYRERIERANKRNAKSNATPRKRNAKSKDRKSTRLNSSH